MGFAWTVRSERAAALVAEDRLPDYEIAAEIGINRRTLTRWRHDPEFLARVDGLIAAARQAAERMAIGQVGWRVAALQERHRRLMQVIAERAASDPRTDLALDGEQAPESRVAGWSTGLLVHTIHAIGRGVWTERVDEYAVDTGLLRELRELEEQAARELGQRQQQVTVSGGLVQVQMRAYTDEEIAAMTPEERRAAREELLRGPRG